ncbi:MAG: hypothetical protein ACI9YT_000055 [Halobacteriales archaeon]|jgi:hypothetical protein
MHRRAFLAAIGGGAALGLSGCAGLDDPPGRGSVTSTGSIAGTNRGSGAGPEPTAEPDRVSSLAGRELPIPSSALIVAAPGDAIPAITDPAFAADWTDIEIERDEGTVGRPRLAPNDGVIGVVRNGEARAYPIRVLAKHEIVNDAFHGPLLVTYCPLCASGMTAVRRVGGEVTTFEVTGKLWKSNLVLSDRTTGSYWSQLYATAIRGQATGQRLSLRPSSLTTWGEWERAYPDGQVLLPPPRSNTVVGPVAFEYPRSFVASYEETRRESAEANRGGLHPKTIVLGIATEAAAKAYPLSAVLEAGVIEDRVGDRPVVITTGPDDALFGYDRRVGDEVLSFSPDGPRHLRAGGSRWRRVSGVAVDGPYAGTRLDQASDLSPLFWIIWQERHPGTSVYGGWGTSETTGGG